MDRRGRRSRRSLPVPWPRPRRIRNRGLRDRVRSRTRASCSRTRRGRRRAATCERGFSVRAEPLSPSTRTPPPRHSRKLSYPCHPPPRPPFAHLDRRHRRGNIRPHVLLNERRPADVTRKSVRCKSKQIKPRLRRPVSSYPFWLRHLPDGHLFTRIRTRIPSAAVDEFLRREPNSVLNGRHSSAEEQVAR